MPESPRRTLRGEVRVRVEREPEESSEVYRIQVASLSNPMAAEELRRKLAEEFSLPAVTRQSPSGGTTQVRIGEFSTRDEAQRFAAGPLIEGRFPRATVVRESIDRSGGAATLALRGPGSLFRLSQVGYLILPASRTTLLRLDGKPYRGILDLSLGRNGLLTVVNQLDMEDYLLGVVPAEISPRAVTDVAALAAQAVAARTYALRNMELFRSEGFDLTADERTQVYGGSSLEHDATNAAVRATHGLAIYHRGNLINAMYCSTCGGKTEDFSNVFGGPEVPYLTSVFCTVETASGNGLETNLRGSHELKDVLFADEGVVANRNLELARILGLLAGSKFSPEFLLGTAAKAEIRKWVDRARELAGKPEADAPAHTGDITARAGFIRFAAEGFFGTREIQQRISSSDVSYYLNNLKDGDRVPASARQALAFVMQRGLWRAYPDNSFRPAAPVRRSDALALLVRWIEFAREDTLRRGVLQHLQRSSIVVKQGNRTQKIPLADHLCLFRMAEGRSTPAASLWVIGGEKLSFHLRRDGKIDFLEVELNPSGAATDRLSPQASWETTIPRTVLSERLRALTGNIGEVTDLVPARLGNSGRVIEIRVEGSRGAVSLNGYKFRKALGLKDTLFTISRTRNADGSSESFTFNGRGWGHGVGLCQVGAAGMARAGRSFEEILKTYYRGVELRKAY